MEDRDEIEEDHTFDQPDEFGEEPLQDSFVNHEFYLGKDKQTE